MSILGWQKVFKFTFLQTIRSKSFIISTIIIAVLFLGVSTLITFIPVIAASETEGGDVADLTEVAKLDTIYVQDTTGITDPEGYQMFADTFGLNFTIANKDDPDGTYLETVKNGTNVVSVNITKEENRASINIGLPADGSVSEETGDTLVGLFYESFNALRYQFADITMEEAENITMPVDSSVIVIGEDTQSFDQMIAKTLIGMLAAIILFMLIFSYGSMVAQSVAMEKISRVMELLLTSVRPLAVIVGKVIAMGCVAILQVLIFGTLALGGVVIFTPVAEGILAGMENVVQDQTAMEIMNAFASSFSEISAIDIILVIITFITGFIFYSMLAGLFGACVSRAEDLQSALQPYSMIGVIGFFLSYMPMDMAMSVSEGTGAMTTQLSPLQIFIYVFPISSPFALPSAMLTENMALGLKLVGVGILILVTVLTTLLVAKVYHQIILHTGNLLKIKDIIGLARNNK